MPKGIPLIPRGLAQNNPVVNAAPLASDFEINQGETRKFDGENFKSFEPKAIATVGEFVDQEKIDMLAFMAEDITIRIATSTDRNAEQVFELNINGKPEFFRRGETKTVKRYFVDRLMRLKTTTYGQEMTINKEGIKSYQYPASTGLKYDFAIIRDDNPIGRSWEKAVLQEAG